jgi:integrase
MAVRSCNSILFIDFYCYLPDGRKVRWRESSGLRDSKKNRNVLESKDKAIGYELKHGRFDYLHFFPNGSRARYFRGSSCDILLSEWWEQWLSEKSLRQNTERGYASAYRIHIGPFFGHCQLSYITEHHLLVFRKTLEERGLKASSINDKIMKPLCMSLLHAYRRGIIPSYPCRGISRLSEAVPDIDPFSFEELRSTLDTTRAKRPEYYDMLFIWSRTGLRLGEVYAVKWKNIDYFNRKLLVKETRLPSGTEGPPKTSHSVRDVDLRPAVIDAFKRQEARTLLQGGYVFLTNASRPFSGAFWAQSKANS